MSNGSTEAKPAQPTAAEPKDSGSALDVCWLNPTDSLPTDVLGAINYSADYPSCVSSTSPLTVNVPFETYPAAGLIECWSSAGPVARGCDRGIHYAINDQHLFAVLELAENEFGGLYSATRYGYALIHAFQSNWPDFRVLRLWNYVDAINEGDGDQERYRKFCLGRHAGMATWDNYFPAATAIGRRDGSRVLQIIWLAGRQRGTRIENPRQVSAFEYPREYGPASPKFARGMLTRERLLISGTASIVGHKTLHLGNTGLQLEETFRNLRALARASGLTDGHFSPIKIYLRNPADRPTIERIFAQEADMSLAPAILYADICRLDLLLEVEAVYSAAGV